MYRQQPATAWEEIHSLPGGLQQRSMGYLRRGPVLTVSGGGTRSTSLVGLPTGQAKSRTKPRAQLAADTQSLPSPTQE